MSSNVVYVLSCSCSQNDWRYVGLTTKGAAHRLRTHHGGMAEGNRRPVYDWMRKHTALGHTIMTRVLEICEFDELNVCESYWEKYLLSKGYSLLNCHTGDFSPMSDATRAKIAATMRGRTHTDETKAKIGDWHRGKIQSPEARAKMSASHTGLKQTVETKAKKSAALKGKPGPGGHSRWHVARGIIRDDCPLCTSNKVTT